MNKFEIAIEKTLKNEGGYVNDPADQGGETKFGISKRSYPNINIKTLTIKQAKAIYLNDFWNRLNCDLIDCQKLANKLFDMSVLMGIKTVVIELQLAICLECCEEIDVDGIIGSETLSYVNGGMIELIYESFLHNIENHLRRLKNKRFIDGWLKRLYS